MGVFRAIEEAINAGKGAGQGKAPAKTNFSPGGPNQNAEADQRELPKHPVAES